MLLWNSCTRFQDENLTGDAKAEIAIAVYTETRAVEHALDAHICNLDTALIYMCREFIAKYVLSATLLFVATKTDTFTIRYHSARLAVTYLMRR